MALAAKSFKTHPASPQLCGVDAEPSAKQDAPALIQKNLLETAALFEYPGRASNLAFSQVQL
jgi:hypothetical protein